MSSDKLFSEFPPISTEEWEAKISADLRGKPYESLLSDTSEGFKVKPYYRSDDIEQNPGYSVGKKNAGWNIRLPYGIAVKDEGKANKKALEALNNGANTLIFALTSHVNFSRLLEGIHLDMISVEFLLKDPKVFNLALYAEYAKSKGFDLTKLNGIINTSQYDNWSVDLELPYQRTLIDVAARDLPNYKTLLVLNDHPNEMSLDIGTLLAKAHELLYKLTEQGIAAKDIANHIAFPVAIGSDYFMEIAKLRALRKLWEVILAEYEVKAPAHIIAYNDFSAEKGTDPYQDMIRHTTQAMSGILGGADALSIHSTKSTKDKDARFFQRIAWNVQYVLKFESHLDHVNDPTAGSYYIETLTNQLAEKAWALFKEIEAKGGYVKAVENI